MQICTTKNENLDAGFQGLRGFFVFDPRSSAEIRVPFSSRNWKNRFILNYLTRSVYAVKGEKFHGCIHHQSG